MKKLLLILSVVLFSCSNSTEPETFLIPSNFRGKVHIIFDEACGEQPRYENGRRLFKIPPSGILLTQLKFEAGIINQEYYLVDEKGKRTKLPLMDSRDYNEEYTTVKNPNEPSRDILGVFNWGRTGNTQHEKEKKYIYSEFTIGTYQQLKDSFDFKYQQRFDSIEYALIKKCRGIK